MAISFGSINTGLPKDIVKQIMEAEKIPIKKMEDSKGKIGEKKILVNELIQLVRDASNVIANNSTARSLRELSIETNEDIIGVTADKNIAEPGSHQFEVTQLARRSSAMTSGFEDKDESYVGVGFIQYFLPDGESRSIYVDNDSASLSGIARLINSDPSNGMKANVVNDGSGTEEPYRLIITLQETGDEKRADFPYFYFVDGEKDFYLEFEREAVDAKVKLDGFEIELPENKTSELIPGLTIDLRKASPGTEFSINISENIEAIQEKVSDLVEKVNGILKFIKTQNTLDENTDTSRTLGGDITLQSLEGRIRSTVFATIQTEFGARRLGDLGIKFQKNGLLQLEPSELSAKISANYKEVAQILHGHITEEGIKTEGFVNKIDDVFRAILRMPDGLLQSRKRGIQNQIDLMDRRIQNRQRVIENKERIIKDRFARLEGEIARIKGQGSGLSALQGGGAAAANMVTQLG
ncbi:MAG: flagellar filament capping protein FliD [Bacteriovoracaceae bacterium]